MEPNGKANENSLTPRALKKNKSYVEAFGKVIKNSTLNNEIKLKFADYLEKLNDNDTKHIGLKELKLLISKYPTKEYFAIYSPILLSYNKNTTTSSKEFQIILIGYMIATCGFSNIGGYKSFHQIIEAITNFMKDNSINIHKSCSHAIVELFDAIEDKKESEKIFSFLVNPFIDLIHKNASNSVPLSKNSIVNGSCVILADLIIHILKHDTHKQDCIFLEKIFTNVLYILNKYKIESSYLYEALAFMIENLQSESITVKLPFIYERVMHILSSNSSGIYQTKIECCNILSCIAKIKLNKNEFFDKILAHLKSACNDRVSKVQIAANQTLRLWLDNGEINDNYGKNEGKTFPDGITNEKSKTKNESKSNKLNLLRNLSKLNKDKEGALKNYFSPDKIKEEIYNKGIGSILKTEKFLSNRASSALRTKFEIKKHNKETDKMNKTCMSKSSDLFKSLKRESKNKLRNSGEDRENNIKIFFKENKGLVHDEKLDESDCNLLKNSLKDDQKEIIKDIDISNNKSKDGINNSKFSKKNSNFMNKSKIASAKNRSMHVESIDGNENQVEDLSEIKKIESMINENEIERENKQGDALENDELVIDEDEIDGEREKENFQTEQENDEISNNEINNEIENDNDYLVTGNKSELGPNQSKSKILLNESIGEKINNKSQSKLDKNSGNVSQREKIIEKKESLTGKSSHTELINKVDKKSPFFVEEENIGDQMMVPDEFLDMTHDNHQNQENNNQDFNQNLENEEIQNLETNPRIDEEKQNLENGIDNYQNEEIQEKTQTPKVKKKISPKKKKVIPKKLNKIVSSENVEEQSSKQKQVKSRIPEKEITENKKIEEDELQLHNETKELGKNSKYLKSLELSIVKEIKFSLLSRSKIFKFNKIEFLSLERNFEDLIENFQYEMEEKLSIFNTKINDLNKVIQKIAPLKKPKTFFTKDKPNTKDSESVLKVINTNTSNLNDSFLNLSRISERQENDLEMDITKTERTLSDTKLYKSNQNINLENLAESKLLSREMGILNNQMRTSRSINGNEAEAFLTPIISQWLNILRDLENGCINKAFEDCLNLGDDILLLRLIFMTGSVLDSLENLTAVKTLLRLVHIWKCGMIQETLFSLIQQSIATKLFENLNLEEKNEICDVLYEFSSIDKESVLSRKSLNLYHSIIK